MTIKRDAMYQTSLLLSAVSMTAACFMYSCLGPRVDPKDLYPADESEETTESFESDKGPGGVPEVDVSKQGVHRVCEPGFRRSCWEDVNGKRADFPGGAPQGNCALGTQACNEKGQWGPCVGLIAPKRLDLCGTKNDDSNCNGIVNEGCGCSPETDKPIECGVSSKGECKLGLRHCVDGKWSLCIGAVFPTAERCDGRGKDEDCDGVPDSDPTECECTVDGLQACQVPGNLGDCALGVQICDKGRLSACRPRFKLRRETCAPPRKDSDTLGVDFGPALGDEDCDGTIDEFDQPEPAIGCEYYAIDEDEDGWGKYGANVADTESSLPVTHGCFCDLPKEYEKKGLVKSPGEGQMKADCADSADPQDYSHEVRPGWHKKFYYFASPALEALKEQGTPWEGGVFDYNCDGKEERKGGWDYLSCGHDGPGKCAWTSSNVFWKEGEEPECGKRIQVPSCKLDPSSTTEDRCIVDHSDMTSTRVACR